MNEWKRRSGPFGGPLRTVAFANDIFSVVSLRRAFGEDYEEGTFSEPTVIYLNFLGVLFIVYQGHLVDSLICFWCFFLMVM